jgi:phosphoribosyl 1,2-cyclic phosphate phosphodiesterase
MKITFLGTGTSQGVPVIACKCETCTSDDPKDKRLRSSVLIENENDIFVIDAGPDFRQQMLRYKVDRLDAILLTHEHKDHTGGMDDVRAYNYIQKRPMPIYCEERTAEALKLEYHYVFAEDKYPGIPQFDIRLINDKNPFKIGETTIIPIRVMHHKLPILGYRIKNFAYITDANYISNNELKKLEGTEVMVLNALRQKKHISHFTLSEAIEVIKKVNPRLGILTHISHLMGKYKEVSKLLPPNIMLAFDGLEIKL